jgi:predicted NAD/FAD-binding protein
MHGNFAIRKNIAVIGTGISGMSAAWLLSQKHDVTVYECDRRTGGHSNTVSVPGAKGAIPVDTGFIVYNEATYPNLTALFDHLKVPTQASDMSFSVSLAGGDLEYCGTNLSGLFAEKRNLLRPRFWSMLRDLQRFYREAPRDLVALEQVHTTLGDYLDAGAYGTAFRHDHLLPLAAAIWSAPASAILNYPAAAFIRFQDNHGLMRMWNRPAWRTVLGGSRAYVERLTKAFADRIRLGSGVTSVHRAPDFVKVRDAGGNVETFDDVVIAAHADQALAMLDNPTPEERRLLGAFRYSRNVAVLHSDPSLMPRRRAVWSSWNHIGQNNNHDGDDGCPTVTYWMNSLQRIAPENPLFVTLNPPHEPRQALHREIYDHPLFDSAAITAQRELWSLQGRRNTWFAGAYFGSGFHEDGLQSGLAVAEALGRVRRPWNVANESGRIALGPAPLAAATAAADQEFAA